VLEGKAPASDAPLAWGAGTRSEVRILVATYPNEGEGGGSSSVYDYYKCILNHTSSAATQPGTGANWTTYWVLDRREATGLSVFSWGSGRGSGALWADSTSYTAGANNYVSSVERKTWIDADGFPAGFNAACMSQGRFWVANVPGERNTIYFSQSISEDKHYSRMYQFADPLNPDDPDVVDTDGGYIKITSAEEIVGLADYIGGVLVLATNGIWYISGADGYFKATSYNIKKVSDDGCMGRFTWTPVENTILYASTSGIYAVNLDDISGEPVVTEATVKIKDFWSSIPHKQRELAEFMYNPDTFNVYIAMNFTTPANSATNNPFDQSSAKRDMLVLHTKHSAWFKYSLSSDADRSKVTIGSVVPIVANLSDFEPVTVSGVNVTVGGAGVTVPAGASAASTITGLIFMKRNGNSMDWSIGLLNGSSFKDFSRSTTDAESYSSYIQSVPQLYTDGGHRKQAPYLYTFFDTVETGFDPTTETYINPGGCFYRIIWNWSSSDKAAKWGTAYPAYKPSRFNYIYEDGTLLSYSVVRNRHRIRGSGPALAFRFESDGDKDFHLLGWQADISVDKDV
jgi:hypothetical protein